MAVIAANYADMSAEVVEFKNIGCGQYLSNVAVTVKLTFCLICLNDYSFYDTRCIYCKAR